MMVFTEQQLNNIKNIHWQNGLAPVALHCITKSQNHCTLSQNHKITALYHKITALFHFLKLLSKIRRLCNILVSS